MVTQSCFGTATGMSSHRMTRGFEVLIRCHLDEYRATRETQEESRKRMKVTGIMYTPPQ